ncbi:MAG: peptidoglycan recognition protein family protein, partial [Myxococcota bacterium]|nr:peptidoglycan recognition protein family protein [Myxococcota bacterium]
MRASLLVLAVALVGCSQGGAALPPTNPDLIPEASVTGAMIVSEWAVDGGHALAPALEIETGATRIGLLVVLHEAGPGPRIEVRGVRADGSASAWSTLETTFEEPDQRVQRLDLDFVAMRAELRVAAEDAPRIATLTWSALVPPPSFATRAPEGEVGLASAELREDLRAMGVRDRAAWGARATRCTSRDPAKYRIAIHHTVTPSGGDIASRLRGIQAYHMDSNGWCDVGYHFLVSLDGTLWEGRELDLLGTHVLSNNTGNVGISYIGCFHSSGCSTYTPFTPPDAMVDSGGRLAGAIARIYGIAVSPETVKGHRDHSGQTTSCPGDHLHSRLGRIRELASGPSSPRFRGVYVEQSFPLARDPFEIAAGATVAGHIDLRNEGTETWHPGTTFLGTTMPRDVASPLAAPDWISPNRAASVDRVVAPGEVGRFAFSVRAPDALGDHPQFFTLVQEGVAWFSDPGEGGPPDDLLQVRVTSVAAPEVDAGTEVDAGVPSGSDAGVSAGDAAIARRDGGEVGTSD